MDPEITWNEFELALSEQRFEDCAVHAEDLWNWLSDGGYVPKNLEARNPHMSRSMLLSCLSAYF